MLVYLQAHTFTYISSNKLEKFRPLPIEWQLRSCNAIFTKTFNYFSHYHLIKFVVDVFIIAQYKNASFHTAVRMPMPPQLALWPTRIMGRLTD